jgi:1-phosphofructokinase family hexose kinase
MILTVTPNPAVDKTIYVTQFAHGDRVRAPRYGCVAGGKGCNVSRVVETLGGRSQALVIVAGTTGQHIVQMLEHDDGVKVVPVWVEGMSRTITTVLEEVPHRQTAFFEPGPAVTDLERQAVEARFKQRVRKATWVTLNGAVGTPSLTGLYAALIPMAHEAGARVLLDSYGPEFNEGLAAGPDIVKPNREEAAALLWTRLDSRAAEWDAVDAFHEKGVASVVMSLGAEGALVSGPGCRAHFEPPPIEEVNPVGSGDSLVGALVWALDRGDDLETAARGAVAAGTANAASWEIGHLSVETLRTYAEQVRVHPA